MEFFRRAKQVVCLAAVAVGTLVLPQNVSAHGELLIQIAEATRKIEAAPNNAQLYLNRGELYREHKNWDEANSDYNRAGQLDPKFPHVNFCRAKLLDDSGQLDESRILFDKIISSSPQDGEALVGRARVLIKLNQCAAAIQDFRNGIEHLSKPKSEYFLELAQALSAEGKPVDALHSLDQGILVHGPLLSLQTFALELELGQKNNSAALARINTLIERAVRKESWIVQRGEILLASGRLTEAQESFAAAKSAISVLPWRLQQGTAMQNLQSRIASAQTEITRAPNLGKTE